MNEHFHVTLWHKLNDQQLSFDDIIGQEVEFFAVEYVSNDNISTLRVELPDNIPIVNNNPHITVSRKRGISAVESNNLLVNNSGEPMMFKLKGIVTKVC